MTNALLCEQDFDELLKNKEWYSHVEIMGNKTNPNSIFPYMMEITIHTSKTPSDKIKKEIIEEIETKMPFWIKHDITFY